MPPANYSSSQKTRLNDLSCGIKNLDRSFFRFVTIQFTRLTDGQTDGQLSHRYTASAFHAARLKAQAVARTLQRTEKAQGWSKGSAASFPEPIPDRP